MLDAIENYRVLDEEFLYEIEEAWRQECPTEIWKYDAPRTREAGRRSGRIRG